MRLSRCIQAVIAVGLMSFGALAPAKAASLLEKSFYMYGPDYSGMVPTCEAALDTIAYQFAIKEERFWNSQLKIVGFDKVREIRNTWPPAAIPRRFCQAVATMTDQSEHVVNYWIGEDTSLIGTAAGIEWCVVGLDRNWAYNPKCKMAQP